MSSNGIAETIATIGAGHYDAALTAAYQPSGLDGQRQRWTQFLERAATHPFLQPSTDNSTASPRLFRAPGRSEIGGNHTDHNHGLAIVGTLTTDIIAVARRRTDRVVRIHNLDTDHTAEIDYAASSAPLTAERGSSAALIRGVAAALDRYGMRLHGFDALTTSAVTAGGGLSSSAAFESLVAKIFHHLANQTPALSVIDLAKAGQYAENEYFGKPCGLEDQIGSLNGGITQIDFENFNAIDLQQIQIDFADYGLQLAVVDSKEDHAELTEHYAAIPAEMRAIAADYGAEVLRAVGRDRIIGDAPRLRTAYGDRAVLRALHFFRECERVQAKVAALRHGNMQAFTRLVRASGASSWMWLQNCIVPDTGGGRTQAMAMVLALTEEFIAATGVADHAACRVHGGGFAGAIQLYLPLEQTAAYQEYIAKQIGSGVYLPLRISPYGAGEIVPNAQ